MYELLGLAAELSENDRQRVQAYEAGLARYRAQDWDAAEAAFRECLAIEPRGSAQSGHAGADCGVPAGAAGGGVGWGLGGVE